MMNLCDGSDYKNVIGKCPKCGTDYNQGTFYKSFEMVCGGTGCSVRTKIFENSMYICRKCSLAAHPEATIEDHVCSRCGGTGHEPCEHNLRREHYICEHNTEGVKH